MYNITKIIVIELCKFYKRQYKGIRKYLTIIEENEKIYILKEKINELNKIDGILKKLLDVLRLELTAGKSI